MVGAAATRSRARAPKALRMRRAGIGWFLHDDRWFAASRRLCDGAARRKRDVPSGRQGKPSLTRALASDRARSARCRGKPCSQTVPGVTPSPAMRPTVLMVDDHDGFRARARVMLEDAGFDVVGEAGDAAAGIEAADRLRPDVVLLDIGLPDEDGFAVA